MLPEWRYVIGIPTVARSRGYLASTVESLLSALGRLEGSRARIVVFNAETPADGNTEVARIRDDHASLLASGRLTIVERRRPAHPDPSDDRQQWRRKQVLDCADLLESCVGLGEYYLHVEDDVVAARNFLALIEAKVAGHQRAGRRWAILSFYNAFLVTDGANYSEYGLTRRYFGFIGQLFRGGDLTSLTDYLRIHFTEAPLDTLVGRWVLSTGGQVIGHAPSLFQHVGVISSFQGRIQIWDTPQFADDATAWRKRLEAGAADVETHHSGSASEFVRRRRWLGRVRRQPFRF